MSRRELPPRSAFEGARDLPQMKFPPLKIGLLAVILLTGMATQSLSSTSSGASFSGTEVHAFMDTLVKEDGFQRDELERIFSRIEYKQNVIDAISRPAEGKPWRDYRPIFLTRSRILQGVKFWNENRDVLARAEQQYGVPAEIIVAILGVETRYGQNFGSFRVIDSLATLGFHYEPRAAFFRKELREFLIMAREESSDPFAMLGSYAGAMGYPQFIPSSFRAYAVDFDKDGKRDFWSGSVDAIGSIGNYLARNGWKAGEPVVLRARANDSGARAVANSSRKPDMTPEQLAANGIDPPSQLAPDELVSVIHLEGEYGDEYWLGLHNFHVIMTYNRSRLYAMAVFQLAQEVRNAR